MLYQDTLTGMLHEVPDSLAEDPYGEAQMVYDGLGNPLGWRFLKKLGPKLLQSKFLKAGLPMLGPWGMIASKALPIAGKLLGPKGQAVARQAVQQLSGVPVALPAPPAISPMAVRRLPAGWRQPQGPNMGPRPRRLYLRCSAWRGPGGLVPVNVGPVAPVVTPQVPVAVAPQAAVVGGPRRYRGRGRRR